MEQKILNAIKSSYATYHDRLLEVMQEFSYKFQRYDVSFTVALYATSDPLEQDHLKNYIRYTDKLVILSENLIAVFFDFVNEADGLKASENFLSKIEPQMFGKKIYVSVVNIKNCESNEECIRKLFTLIEYEIKNNIDDVPMVD